MQRILQTGTCRKGLSLIELIVVIFIISIITAIVIPSFWSTEQNSLLVEAKHLQRTLQYIYDESISKKESFILLVNLDNDTYGFRSELESRNFRIQGGGVFRDIMVPSLGIKSEGEVSVEFGLLGPAEPIVFHLMKGDAEYTIMLNHLTGRSHIIEGYVL